jgi:hypothetical protein
MNVDEFLASLKREAERATGAMRAAAENLETIAKSLPDYGEGTERRLELFLTSSRLRITADLLTAEIATSNPMSARLATRFGKSALKAGAKFGLAAAAAFGGVAATTFTQYLEHENTAQTSISIIYETAPGISVQMLRQIDTELDAVATILMTLAEREPELVNRSAFRSVIENPMWSLQDNDRKDRIQTMLQTASEMHSVTLQPEILTGDPTMRKRLDALGADVDVQMKILEDLSSVQLNLEGGDFGTEAAFIEPDPIRTESGVNLGAQSAISVGSTVTRAAPDESLNLDAAVRQEGNSQPNSVEQDSDYGSDDELGVDSSRTSRTLEAPMEEPFDDNQV